MSGAVMGRPLALLLATTCGIAVANVYFPQAISPLIARGLHLGMGAAAMVVTVSQLGYALGIFLLVPLGDVLAPRRLIAGLCALTSAGLLVAGLADGPAVLLAASGAIAAATVVPQLIIPMAAGMVEERRRGELVGTLLSGLLAGILLARAFSGLLGAWLGWRAPYLIQATAMLVLAGVLINAVPATHQRSSGSYRTLIIAPFELLRSERELRRSCFYQATMFGGFTAAWTTIPLLLTGATYDLGAEAVALVALAGVGSVLSARAAGRWVDRAGPDRVNLPSFVAAVIAAGVLSIGQIGGVGGFVAIIAAILLLDTAVQCGQIANQARALAIRPDARSRLNTAYMTCAFLGGTAGSWLGIRAYDWLGWTGLCTLIALLAATALASHFISRQEAVRTTGAEVRQAWPSR